MLPSIIDYSYQPIPNFSLEEIACTCCGLVIMQPKLLEIEKKVREEFGQAIKANSWCRCPEHNSEVGGVDNSYHRFGKAIDQRPYYGALSQEFVAICQKHFPFVKVYETFCHCDIRGPRTLQP